jgi:hypothetical protein
VSSWLLLSQNTVNVDHVNFTLHAAAAAAAVAAVQMMAVGQRLLVSLQPTLSCCLQWKGPGGT